MPSISVYSGKLDFSNEVENEHAALVIPFGISNGAPVGLYFQWSTQTGNHSEKENHTINATFREVSTASEHQVKGTFDDGEYKFEVTIGFVGGRQTLPTVIMSDCAGNIGIGKLSVRENSFDGPPQPVNKKVMDYCATA